MVIELVGPAAVGKSTLCEELGRRGGNIVAGLRLPKHHHLSTVVSLLPTFLALHWPPRAVLLPEMKRITYLRTLRRTLGRVARGDPEAIVLEEGPVYFHARAIVYGGRRVTTPGFERWWRGSIEAWAQILAHVVVLDAPDALLAARIRRRGETEPGAHSSDVEHYAVGQYREAYDRVLADLAAAGGPSVMRVDTSRQSADAIAEGLFANAGLSRGRARR